MREHSDPAHLECFGVRRNVAVPEPNSLGTRFCQRCYHRFDVNKIRLDHVDPGCLQFRGWCRSTRLNKADGRGARRSPVAAASRSLMPPAPTHPHHTLRCIPLPASHTHPDERGVPTHGIQVFAHSVSPIRLHVAAASRSITSCSTLEAVGGQEMRGGKLGPPAHSRSRQGRHKLQKGATIGGGQGARAHGRAQCMGAGPWDSPLAGLSKQGVAEAPRQQPTDAPADPPGCSGSTRKVGTQGDS